MKAGSSKCFALQYKKPELGTSHSSRVQVKKRVSVNRLVHKSFHPTFSASFSSTSHLWASNVLLWLKLLTITLDSSSSPLPHPEPKIRPSFFHPTDSLSFQRWTREATPISLPLELAPIFHVPPHTSCSVLSYPKQKLIFKFLNSSSSPPLLTGGGRGGIGGWANWAQEG